MSELYPSLGKPLTTPVAALPARTLTNASALARSVSYATGGALVDGPASSAVPEGPASSAAGGGAAAAGAAGSVLGPGASMGRGGQQQRRCVEGKGKGIRPRRCAIW